MRRIVDTSDPVNWSHPLNRGLVSWWLALPDQQRGVIFRDLCGRNHGTLTSMDPATDWGGPSGRPGGWGTLDFDGTDDYVSIGNPSSVAFGDGNWSLSCWFLVRSTGRQILIGKDELAKRQFGLVFDGQNNASDFLQVFYGKTDGSLVVQDSTEANKVSANTWAHLVGQRLGTSLQLFLNGSFLPSVASSGTAGTMLSASSTLMLGRRGFAGFTNELNGKIDDVRIYNRALSATEVATYYKLSCQGYPGLLNRLPTRRYAPEQAVADGLSIPIAAYHYNHHLGSMA